MHAHLTLTQAIRDHAGLTLEEIRSAGRHGADAGFGGFTYTKDGAEFARRDDVRPVLWEMLADDAEQYGSGNVAAFIGTFGRADMTDSPDGFDCLLAWYALEECGRFWLDRREA